MSTEEYITLHRNDDPAQLALKGAPQGVDIVHALRQIEGWQTARKKLPLWAACDGILYPVRLSMQQCSSQTTAAYKAQLTQQLIPEAERHSMADLTGGLGVDFSFLAALFRSAWYIERDAPLCAAARHNMPLLGLQRATIVNADATTLLHNDILRASTLPPQLSLIYLDPARRDGVGRKLVRIEDCMPDISTLQERLLQLAPIVMVKLSPMLDITQALKTLRHVSQVHIVSADGECKELLLVMQRGHEGEAVTHCEGLSFTRSEEAAAVPQWADRVGQWLYIPSPAMMKAAPYRLLSQRYNVLALPPDTHLYTSPEHIGAESGSNQNPSPEPMGAEQDDCQNTTPTSIEPVSNFPGRIFRIDDVCDIKTFRRQHPEVTAANIIVRGYPDTPDGLRKRLKLKDGGDNYLIATTLPTNRHALLLCHK